MSATQAVPGHTRTDEVIQRIEPVGSPPPAGGDGKRVAFTVDVEDWYQSCIDMSAPISERVPRNVERVLALLDGCGVKGTFFVQGRVAETFPGMVRELVDQGHEVQSHGHSHESLFNLDREGLREELRRAKETVEDAAGTPVTAFRAPDFSILSANLWALEVLAEAGFTTDSSIFPIRSRHYGIPGWELGPHRIELRNGASILEVPVAIWEVRGRGRVPVAGGGYFRFLPQELLERGLRSIAASGRPAVVYCHPYEFSARELDAYRGQIPELLRITQGLGRERFVERIRGLMEVLPFGRFDEVLATGGVAT
jgi:polysaccharide deacetylase family protein (PEP-CTERM system associated)